MLAQAVAAIALGLLAASGVAKLLDPEPTTGAMRSAHLPASRLITSGLGVVEILAAVTALSVGGVAVGAAAVLYAGFTIFTLAATRQRIPIQSCGCFGREDTPPSTIHVVFNGAATVALVFLAVSGLGPIDWAIPAFQLAMYLVFTVIGVQSSYLLLTQLPQLLAVTRAR